MNPKITIISVVYNAQEYLEDTIVSIISQTYNNFEYIIIDGGSTDKTLSIVEKYKDNIAFFLSEKDNGIFHAMNKGIKYATGDWLNFMNAGDNFASNDILTQVAPLLKKNTDIYYGNYLDDKKRIIYAKTYNIFLNIPYCHQAAFYQKTTLKKFRFNEEYKISGDYAQYLDIKNNGGKLEKINLVICQYLGEGISANNKKTWTKEHLKIHKKHLGFFVAYAIYILRMIKIIITNK